MHSGGPYTINAQHSSNSIRPFQWISTLIRSRIVFMSPSSLARRYPLYVEQQCNPDTNHANPITLLHSPKASTLTHSLLRCADQCQPGSQSPQPAAAESQIKHLRVWQKNNLSWHSWKLSSHQNSCCCFFFSLPGPQLNTQLLSDFDMLCRKQQRCSSVSPNPKELLILQSCGS